MHNTTYSYDMLKKKKEKKIKNEKKVLYFDNSVLFSFFFRFDPEDQKTIYGVEHNRFVLVLYFVTILNPTSLIRCAVYF